jgi:hypothetical protein
MLTGLYTGKKQWHWFALIAVLVLLANWFLTFHLVCLKDDNSFYYQPVRMYLSDALHHGTLPYWNPYIMGGVPQVSDMQGTVWNPLTQLLAYCFTYNHTCFIAEFLMYLIAGGCGMYLLTGLFTQNRTAQLLAVAMYCCCGFVSGIANFINWMGSLGVLPWFFYTFYALLQQPTLKRSLAFAVCTWLLVVCGYPAFFIYAAYMAFALFCRQLYQWLRAGNKQQLARAMAYLLLAALVCFLLALPAIFAYVEFMPYYNRASHLATDDAFRDCFYPSFFTSLFVPASVYNKTFDVLCHSANRDIYFGFIPLVLLVLFIANLKTHVRGIGLLLTGMALFTLVFLFGYLTPLGNLCYKWLPLMGTFKWSAAARIFLIAIIGFAVALQYASLCRQQATPQQIRIVRVAAACILAGIVFTYLYTNSHYAFETEVNQRIFKVSAVIQLTWAVLVMARARWLLLKPRWLLLLALLDLGINYTAGMAATGVGNVKPVVFNRYATKFYAQNTDHYINDTPLVNNRRYFQFDPWTNNNASKIMNGTAFLISYTMFAGYEKNFLTDTADEAILRNHPFAFSEDVRQLHIVKAHIDYTHIQLQLQCSNAGTVILQQNNYLRWKETSGKPIGYWRECFMTLPVQAGINNINLVYNKGYFLEMWYVSMATLLLVMVLLLGIYVRAKYKP